MNFSEFSETYSWKQAIDLGPALLSLADELPAAETMGLGLHLHQLAIELPAGVASDLLAGKSADLSVILKLITTLELIDRIYPALDASPVRRRADDLAARLAGDNFADRPKTDALETLARHEPASDTDETTEVAEPTPTNEAVEPAPDLAGTPLSLSGNTSAEAAEDTDNAPAPAQPERPAAPDGPDTTFSVTVQPTHSSEESHVQPDSIQ